MNKKGLALSVISVAIGLGSLSAIHQSWQERQDLYARWRIEINKETSSKNKFRQLSRGFESEYISKDFPAFFYSSTTNKRERADVSCRFAKETDISIFHECTAKTNINYSPEFNQLEAWIYRISIPGYERKKSRMLTRLVAAKENAFKAPTQDFVDPINHPEEGSPEIQRLLVPATSVPTKLNYKKQIIFNFGGAGASHVPAKPDQLILRILIAGAGVAALAAVALRNQRGKLAYCSIALSSLAAIELTSSLAFQNPLPRNVLIEKWRLADALDNIALSFSYQQWTNGLRGEDLVNRAWNRINSSPKIVESINPKVSGLLFSKECQDNSPDNIDL